MPGTDMEGAMALANKVREAISGLVFPDFEEPVTASIGLAGFPDDASDPATLVRHADQALYVAKRAGRNRVERFTANAAVDSRGPIAAVHQA
jgi:diguanylate cyclase (GGDEF)-like protein